MCHGSETLNSVGERFGVSTTTSFRIRKRLTALIATFLVNKFISWPLGNVDDVKAGFSEHSLPGRRMDGVIGAIDGTHITICPPKEYPEAWVNRKSVHSMQLQLVVDANRNILDAYTGHPGSVHDAKVFKASPLGKILEGKHPDYQPSSMCPEDTFLVGDAAYPLLPNLITPFKNVGPVQEERNVFNKIQSSNRIVVERTIGLLKSRNRRLMYTIDVEGEEEICNVIMTACVIHQLALRCDDESDLNELLHDILTMQNQQHQQHAIDVAPHEPVVVRRPGEERRTAIMQQLGLVP